MSFNTLVLVRLPDEILLHIFSYLDLPDLDVLAQVAPVLAPLTTDPVLHNYRIWTISPSRVNHDLFGTSPQGHAMRPTVGELVQRGVIRGLGIERRWRMGAYFYSVNSIIQYENGVLLARRHASHVLSVQLRRWSAIPSNALRILHSSRVLPDVESSSPNVARSLQPVMRKLKWSLQRDQLAKAVKNGPYSVALGTEGFGAWLESKGQSIVPDGEKVRLAVCPGIKKKVGFFEKLARS